MSDKASTITQLASTTTYTMSAVSAGLATLSFNQWMMLLSLAIAIATFFVNLYFKRKEDKRAIKQAISDAKIKDFILAQAIQQQADRQNETQ
ncbi:phage holin [Catenovulum sediminis]|uniref:Phage holin n=1 Tax=Catenovulum sediminis TaxID=1740262 RepID=A0ABV1RBM9_9ALTE